MIYAYLGLAYLLGATPTSYWVGRAFHGLDLREHGSGNLGATNAFRVLGWPSALPVVLIDIAKGYVPAALFAGWAGVTFPWSLAFGIAAIGGHMFSLWVGFKGGKGMATGLGVFLALAPLASGIALVLWLGLTFGTGYVSVGSIAAAAVLPALIAATPHQGGATLVYVAIPLAAFIVWKHRANIRRLREGTENRFGTRADAPAETESETGGTP